MPDSGLEEKGEMDNSQALVHLLRSSDDGGGVWGIGNREGRKDISIQLRGFFSLYPALRRELGSHLLKMDRAGLTDEEIDLRHTEETVHFLEEWHREQGKYLEGNCPGCRNQIPMFYFTGTQNHGEEHFDLYTCPVCHETYAEERIRGCSSEREPAREGRVAAVAGQ